MVFKIGYAEPDSDVTLHNIEFKLGFRFTKKKLLGANLFDVKRLDIKRINNQGTCFGNSKSIFC